MSDAGANYSTDDDLRAYEVDLAPLGDLHLQHHEAKTQIDLRIRKMGFSTQEIADLSDRTKLDLRSIAAKYVLYLAYLSNSTQNGDTYDKKAEHFLERFNADMENLVVEVDANDDGVPEKESLGGGSLSLG